LEEWHERGRGGISYRSAQLLTGHGCFGEFLQWIGRERTAECHHYTPGHDGRGGCRGGFTSSCPITVEQSSKQKACIPTFI